MRVCHAPLYGACKQNRLCITKTPQQEAMKLTLLLLCAIAAIAVPLSAAQTISYVYAVLAPQVSDLGLRLRALECDGLLLSGRPELRIMFI